MTKRKINLILATATALLKPNNTVTTLEIKNKLRNDYPEERWFQDDVSDVMDQAANEGGFTFVNEPKGAYRIYSEVRAKATKTSVRSTRISKTKAVELMSKAGGKFFTVVYTKKDGTERTMNCRYKGDAKVTPLGYLKVIDVAKHRKNPADSYRQINLQTLKSLSISGVTYKIN